MLTTGRVVRVFSGGADVHCEGRIERASLRRRHLAGRRTAKHVLAPGDLVQVDPQGVRGVQASIEEVLERRNSICRAAAGGRYRQVLYANVDLLVVVGSVRDPDLRPGLFDRFLAAAEREEIEGLLVANKSDLGREADSREVAEVYRAIGYPLVFTSASTGAGLDELRGHLDHAELVVFAGHSGVGKSSLLNQLFPAFAQSTREVSRSGHGRHTTTQTRLLPREDGHGYVADTPGIRSFALFDMLPEEVGFCFREMAPLVAECKFKSCQHTHEPHCAVKAALESGAIHSMRYQSYLRILESLGAEDPAAAEEEG